MMVYYITGSNIFGQWFECDHIINEFRAITENNHESGVSTKGLKLLQINWCYNILEIASDFYLSGYVDEQENQLVEIPMPKDYSGSKANLMLAGNDYHLILISKNTKTLWVTDISMKKEFKKICLNVEEPVEKIEKRQKIDNNICKVVFINDTCLYLTLSGHVYNGILPTFVDTTHCRGKICDIQSGFEHCMLLTDVGVVYTWGNGRRLQLGHGDVSNLELPTEVEALSGIKITKICCGGWHSLALSEFGDLYAWGWNDTGQLGIKHEKEQQSYAVPTLVDIIDKNGEAMTINIKDIACGSRHSAVLLEDNSVWTTGCNKYGQLGFSEEKYPTVCYFKKAFQCDKNCILICGQWTTVIHKSS